KRQANPLPDEDFAATVARARDAVAAMPVDTDDQKAQKESFENAFKALEGVTGPVDTVAGIVARGPHTVELTLEAPSGLFPWYLAQSTCVIVPREEVERYGQEWPNHPVGTGPFKVGPGTYNFAEGITLVRNDDYFKGPARLNGIRYIVEREEKKRIEGFKAGQYEHTDIPPEDFETVMADANLKGMLVERPTFDLYHIAFNCAKPPFKDNPQLRQALNYAVDKNYIAETVLKGTRVVAPSFMPVNFPNFTPRHQGYPYNAGEATRLLEEAGYPNGQGLPLLRLWCSNDPTHIQIMTAVQQDLKKVGVQVELKTLEWASFLETMDAGEY
ncbi:MAG TPA: ABC transporter substrate-binding protein, partial [bacterium]|nr:ABC transporter substrate-binding protein [bacterium]